MMNALKSARDWSLCVCVCGDSYVRRRRRRKGGRNGGEKRADGNAGKRRGVRAVMAFRGHSPSLLIRTQDIKERKEKNSLLIQ